VPFLDAAFGPAEQDDTPPVTLTPGEASALVASLVAVGPYTSATAQSALAKLLASLIEPSEQGSTGPSTQR
jgi:predicted DNA-binding transcriptional regulator YafY